MNDSDEMHKARRVTKEDAEIGFRIRKLRQDKRISQSEIAEKCGISYQQFQKYEYGRDRITGLRLKQIADSLDVDIGQLLNPANDSNLSPLLQYQRLHNIDQAAARLCRKAVVGNLDLQKVKRG